VALHGAFGTEDEWVGPCEVIERIRYMESLGCSARPVFREVCPFQAFADALKCMKSLCKLKIALDGETRLEFR
jgi:hypothetical protein